MFIYRRKKNQKLQERERDREREISDHVTMGKVGAFIAFDRSPMKMSHHVFFWKRATKYNKTQEAEERKKGIQHPTHTQANKQSILINKPNQQHYYHYLGHRRNSFKGKEI